MPERDIDPAPTRASLLGRVRNVADHSSWEEFDHIYRELIYNVAIRAGLRPEEAEDAVQETFADLARKMPEYEYDRARGPFKRWLFRLARLRVIDQFRKRPPIALPPEPPTTTDDPSRTSTFLHRVPDPAESELDRIWDEQWAKHLMQTAETRVKRKIDPQQFQIYDLYANKGWPAERVADAFRVEVAQVYLAKSRVLEKITNEIKLLDTDML
ncbi:MAG: sigma-70 family RNA polymerase sigma factor [Verrucomicrobia bacterium]|nr:sigma-70 family RNA polymerase sigma factor [Verrucomicrobiota bacterium]